MPTDSPWRGRTTSRLGEAIPARKASPRAEDSRADLAYTYHWATIEEVQPNSERQRTCSSTQRQGKCHAAKEVDRVMDDERIAAESEKRVREHATSETAVRDHLANKRTMLAWCRTGIAVIALGFVVARFGLLLRELRASVPRPIPTGLSTVFGTSLVIIGAILIALATLEYLHVGRAIDRYAYRWSPKLEIALSVTLVVAALLLAVYLVVTG